MRAPRCIGARCLAGEGGSDFLVSCTSQKSLMRVVSMSPVGFKTHAHVILGDLPEGPDLIEGDPQSGSTPFLNQLRQPGQRTVSRGTGAKSDLPRALGHTKHKNRLPSGSGPEPAQNLRPSREHVRPYHPPGPSGRGGTKNKIKLALKTTGLSRPVKPFSCFPSPLAPGVGQEGVSGVGLDLLPALTWSCSRSNSQTRPQTLPNPRPPLLRKSRVMSSVMPRSEHDLYERHRVCGPRCIMHKEARQLYSSEFHAS